MLEGPDSKETEEDKECVITPSTSVKFNAALRERNRINFMRNYLLLIGTTSVYNTQSNIWSKLLTLISVTFLGTVRERVSGPPPKNEEVCFTKGSCAGPLSTVHHILKSRALTCPLRFERLLCWDCPLLDDKMNHVNIDLSALYSICMSQLKSVFAFSYLLWFWW